MARSTEALREAWKAWACNPTAMKIVAFGPDRIRVVPQTEDAWTALARTMIAHGYHIRPEETDSYNCRQITGGSGLSLHSYGIALDVNWGTNPYIRTPTLRRVRFSPKPTQSDRARDVEAGLADTDMTPEMIEDILAIKTTAGMTVFEWGGSWRTVKDAMHFQIDLVPEEVATGIDWNTVKAQEEDMFVRKGDRGPLVQYYQLKLGRLSPVSPGPPDGVYGAETAASTKAFQMSRTPPVNEGQDGDFIGPFTKNELDRAEVEKAIH